MFFKNDIADAAIFKSFEGARENLWLVTFDIDFKYPDAPISGKQRVKGFSRNRERSPTGVVGPARFSGNGLQAGRTAIARKVARLEQGGGAR